MKKIKILYLVSSLKKCGPINVLFGITKNLNRDLFDIVIICLSKENQASMKNEFEKLGCEIMNLNNSRIGGLLKNQGMIQSIVQSKAIDIVHSHGLRADILNSNLKGVKQFTTIHNFPDEDYILQYGKVKGVLMASKHRYAINGIANPIACSEYIKDKFWSQYKIKSQCIKNGIDTTAFLNKSSQTKNELRTTIGLPLNKTIFLVSGSLIKRKDPETILKAFSTMNMDASFLVLIGSGKLEKTLRTRYEARSIIFKGNVANVSDYLSASDYFISASISEGLPNAVMEAMCAGLGVILSNISSHREIVGEAYSFLFPLSNTSILKERISAFLNQKTDPLKKSCQDLIVSDFNAIDMATNYQRAYLKECQNTEK